MWNVRPGPRLAWCDCTTKGKVNLFANFSKLSPRSLRAFGGVKNLISSDERKTNRASEASQTKAIMCRGENVFLCMKSSGNQAKKGIWYFRQNWISLERGAFLRSTNKFLSPLKSEDEFVSDGWSGGWRLGALSLLPNGMWQIRVERTAMGVSSLRPVEMLFIIHLSSNENSIFRSRQSLDVASLILVVWRLKYQRCSWWLNFNQSRASFVRVSSLNCVYYHLDDLHHRLSLVCRRPFSAKLSLSSSSFSISSNNSICVMLIAHPTLINPPRGSSRLEIFFLVFDFCRRFSDLPQKRVYFRAFHQISALSDFP